MGHVALVGAHEFGVNERALLDSSEVHLVDPQRMRKQGLDAELGHRVRFVGVELYFDDPEKAKEFYLQTLGLDISDEQVRHHAEFDCGAGLSALSARGLNRTPLRIRPFCSSRRHT